VMGRRLIVNADGFGFTEGVNRGILETFACGVVQSTSVLANFPPIEELPELHRRFPEVSVGVHLNLSVGRPVLDASQIPTLVGSDGRFRPDFVRALLRGRIRSAEMKAELTAQIRRILDLGVSPTHIDGHQNKHLYPPFFRVALQVARELGIPCMRTHRRYLYTGARSARSLFGYYARHPRQVGTHLAGRLFSRWAEGTGLRLADRLITPGYIGGDHKSSLDTWCRLLADLPEGWNEIYCHPGYPDDALREHATYVEERRQEIDVLCDPRVREVALAKGVEFVSFHELIGAGP